MKLKAIIESEYDGLEDADEFSDPHACLHCGESEAWAWCNQCHANICTDCGTSGTSVAEGWVFFIVPGTRSDPPYIEDAYCPQHRDMIGPDPPTNIVGLTRYDSPSFPNWMSPSAFQAYLRDEYRDGETWDGGHGKRGQWEHGETWDGETWDEISESISDYDGLEDADEFSNDIEFMGEANLGPHIFRVWHHKQLNRISMEINGYELGFEDDHMPTAQKEDILKKLITLRPDLVPFVKDHSINGQLMDTGLALVQNQHNGQLAVRGVGEDRRRNYDTW